MIGRDVFIYSDARAAAALVFLICVASSVALGGARGGGQSVVSSETYTELQTNKHRIVMALPRALGEPCRKEPRSSSFRALW